MNAVQDSVARALLRTLCGFKGYPRKEGESRFVEVLCECSISVEHASAIIASFDGEFPTLKDIRDSAYGLRPKFELTPDRKAQLEAKYGKPDRAFARRLRGVTGGNHEHDRRAILWQSIRDGIFYTETSMGRSDLAEIEDKDERIKAFKFWRQAAVDNQRAHPADVQAFRDELEQSSWDDLMAYDWARGDYPPSVLRSVPAPVTVLANPITQADIDRELREREPGDGE